MAASNIVLLSGFMSVNRRPLQIQIRRRMKSNTMHTYTSLSTLNLKCTTSKNITPLMMLKHKSELCAIHPNTCNKEDPVLVHHDIQPNCCKDPSPIWVYMDAMLINALKKPAIALATMLLLLLMMMMPHHHVSAAWAASGGRMGGWSSSSSSSSRSSSRSSFSSSRSSSRSSSSPSSSSSGYSSSGSSSSSPSWSSSSSPSRSSSRSSSCSSSPSSSSSSSSSSPSSSSQSYPSSTLPSPLAEIIVMALFLYALNIGCLVNKYEDDPDFVMDTIVHDISMMLNLIMAMIQLMLMVITIPIKLALSGVGLEKTSVLQLQVGLLGLAKSLQRELNQIAETCHTSTPKDLHHVLTETTQALLRHPDYCISAYSTSDVKTSTEEGQKLFNQLSIEERAKFDEETLVNVDNIRRQRPTSLGNDGFNNEYIVVTILVAAQGDHNNLPTINESKDLKDALQKLNSIPSNQIRGVEVLWTPQAENDTLSESELHEDYPLLRPI